MSGRGQLVTLQLGQFANYVGAHFWNTQDEAAGLADAEHAELDAGVMYRQANGRGGVSFTPRLVLFDWVGALGGVPAQPGELTVPAAAHDVVVTTWSSAARVVRHPHVEKSRFYRALEEEEDEEDGDGVREAAAAQQEKEPDAAPQQAAGDDAPASQGGVPVLAEAADALEGSVRYWTDYSKAVLHPRSAVLFSAPWGIDTPDGYGATHEYTDSTAAEEAHERIRYFAEECDTLAGFHILAHDCGAFGALTEAVLTHIGDAYPGRPALLYSVRPPAVTAAVDAGAPRRRALSEALALWKCASNVQVYAPLGCRSPATSLASAFNIDDAQPYHTSAPLAAAVDVTSLAWRLARHYDGGCGASEFGEALNLLSGGTAARPLVATSLAMPAAPLRRQPPPRGAPPGATKPEAASLDALLSLTDGMASPPEAPTYEAYSLRGLRFEDGTAADVDSVQMAMHYALRASGTRCPRALCATTARAPIPLAFPRILHPALKGAARGGARQSNPSEVGVMSRQCAADDFGPLLKRQADSFRPMSGTAPSRALFAAWGLAQTDAEEAADALATLASSYLDSAVSDDD